MRVATFTLAASLSILGAVNSFPISFNQIPEILSLNPNFLEDHLNLNIPFGKDLDDEFKHSISEEDYNSLPLVETEALQAMVEEAGLREGAEAFYSAALKSVPKYNNPTRVIGSPGHWKSLGHIIKELNKLNGYYKIRTQKFKALDSDVYSFSLLIDGVEPKSLAPLGLTPPTPHKKPVHGNLVLVEGFGCSLEDFPDFTPGKIALIKRGECAFANKSINAGVSGALGAIIYDDEPLRGTLGEPTGKEVPTVSITSADAKEYIDALTKDPHHEFEVTLFIDGVLKRISVLNVIADTKFGDKENIVSLGAHSDSVAEGPGINDDGSGSISLIEVAKYLSNFKVNNAVRFAWWAAEEEGLLGSYHYANSLSPEENSKIRLFMDYDMMASPNYEYQVYDANNKDHPNGSGDLKDLYVDWYTSHGYNYTLIPFDGRSDYVGFIDNGIPAGGIAAGAEGVKTEEGVEKFGGKAGEWFDQCYHQLCDDLTNPSYEAWVVNTKLIAHTVATYANSFEGFPERETSKSSIESISEDFKYRASKLII